MSGGSPGQGLLCCYVVLLKASHCLARRGGGSVSCNDYEGSNVNRTDGDIHYNAWNWFLWVVSAIVILGFLIALLVLHVILLRRHKRRELEEASRMMLKNQPPAFVRTSTNLMKSTPRNGKVSKKVQPEADCQLYDIQDVK